MQTLISRRKAMGGLAAMFVAGSTGILSSTRPAMAHEAPCPYCQMTVTQDTPTQDNETVMKNGRKRIEYKCVFCALADASEIKGDVTIAAPSEIKGSPVVIKRVADKWTATPSTAVFVAQKGSHKVCQTLYRAFTNKAALDAYVKANSNIAKDAKPLSLDDMVKLAAAG